MKPMTLQFTRDEAIVVNRAYQQDDGTPIDITGWHGTFEVNFISQLHGQAGHALNITEVDQPGVGEVVITGATGTAQATVHNAAVQALEHAVYLWSFWIAPPVGAPVQLGWGLLELTP